MHQSDFDCHLSYCMNVHPAKTLDDVLKNLQRFTAPIRKKVSPNAQFGVGLWIPASALAGLRRDPTPLRSVLDANDLYLFTINGFPYGTFHGASVKTKVYHPDWSTQERLDYTCALVDILSALLPEGTPGSISTVPITYGKELPDGALANIAAIAAYVRESNAKTGKQVSIALEPEPDCYLEDTPETITFFEILRQVNPEIGDEIGVCFDTCHISLQHEDLPASWDALTAAGISIHKVQLSAALTCDNTDQSAANACLQPFAEPVYLHQTRVQNPADGTITRYPDLQPALDANLPGQWLVHYHVPLPYLGDGPLGSTATSLTPSLLQKMARACQNLEVETYTFDVLPEPKSDIVTSISNELFWVQDRLKKHDN